jgi:hypothetical protein
MKPAGETLNESLFYEVVVTDKDGRVIQHEKGVSRSYTEAWNKIINANARQGSNTIKDTGGTDRSVGAASSHLRAAAGIGDTNRGIRIGRGTTPVDISDYALENPVDEGTGPGQLSHQEMQFSEPAVVGSDCSFKLWRVMFNYAGTLVSGIREIGCYVMMASYYALAFRDVLISSFSIPDGGAITITYEIKVSA